MVHDEANAGSKSSNKDLLLLFLFLIILPGVLFALRLLMPGAVLLGFIVGLVHRLYLKARQQE